MEKISIKNINPFIRYGRLMPHLVGHIDEKNITSHLMHAHDWRLFIIVENHALLYIKDQKFNVEKNSLIIIPPLTPYMFCQDERKDEKIIMYNINFDLTHEHSDNTTPRAPSISHLAKENNYDFDKYLLEELDGFIISKASPIITNNILTLVTEKMLGSNLSDTKISALLKFILADIIEQNKQNTTITKATVTAILQYITSNINSPFTIKNMSDELHYHPFYLSKIFKDSMGQSLHKFIMQERLSYAKHYLVHTNKSIDDISLNVGFCNVSHFCKAFKREFGISPEKYRKTTLT